MLAAPVLLIAGVFIANQQLWDGMHVWNNASNATASVVAVIGPIAASVSAFDAIRRGIYRQGPVWDVSVIGPARASFSVFIASICWNSLVYFGIALWTLLPVALADPWGSPVWPALAAGLVGQWVAVSVGHLAGTMLPRRFVAILAAPLTYGLIVLSLFLSSEVNPRFLQLSLAPQNIHEVYYEVNNRLLWMQTGWLLLLTASVAGTACLILRPKNFKVAVAVAVSVACSLVVGGGIVTSPASVSLIRPSDVEFECVEGDGKLCFHPAYNESADTINLALDKARSRMEGTAFAIGTVWLTQRGPFSHPIPEDDKVVHIDELSQGWEERAIVEMFQESEVYGVGSSACSQHGFPGADSFRLGLGTVVATWAAGSNFSNELPDEKANRLATEFLATADARKPDWIDSHLREICTG